MQFNTDKWTNKSTEFRLCYCSSASKALKYAANRLCNWMQFDQKEIMVPIQGFQPGQFFFDMRMANWQHIIPTANN